ncbi:MAG: hypothetical protein FWD69_11650 [Polyangiaceae bacterium]|nr:hypothetical protein [Polyangiaceae bacterium]
MNRLALLAMVALFGAFGACSRCDSLTNAPAAVRLTSFDGGARLAVRPSAGCGQAPPSVQHATILADGAQRSYEISLPAHYDSSRAYPLVLMFHGSGGNGSSFHRLIAQGEALADSMIAVYPDAVVRRVWADNFAPHWGKTEDLPLFDALVERMKSTLCVDEARVFAFGWSSGGYFANQLGCVRPSTVRAIVALSGGGPENVQCEVPMTVFIHHDRDDGSVAFSTGQGSRDQWLHTNHCSGKASESDGCTIYAGCSASVVWCETSGNGHDVPRSARDAAWTFLSAL